MSNTTALHYEEIEQIEQWRKVFHCLQLKSTLIRHITSQ